MGAKQETKYFQDTAQKMGRNSELVDINVFFGPDEKIDDPPRDSSRKQIRGIAGILQLLFGMRHRL